MLTQAVEAYVAMRRATGFAFRSEGSLLQSFAAFSDAAGKQYISSEIAIELAQSAPSLSQRARRLGQVIRFARYIRAEDLHHEIPPTVFGSENRPRPVPYIFSRDEIQRILQAASTLGKRNAFRGHTYNTFFALLACTGLRVSEAIHLCFQDITADGLVIRCSSSAKADSFPFTRLRMLAWNSTSSGGAPLRHWMITCSFPCEDGRCFCMMPKPHSTTLPRRSASLVEPTFHAPRSTPCVTRLR